MSQETPNLEKQREELLNKALVERIAMLEFEIAQYKVQCTLFEQELEQWRNNAPSEPKKD